MGTQESQGNNQICVYGEWRVLAERGSGWGKAEGSRGELARWTKGADGERALGMEGVQKMKQTPPQWSRAGASTCLFVCLNV